MASSLLSRHFLTGEECAWKSAEQSSISRSEKSGRTVYRLIMSTVLFDVIKTQAKVTDSVIVAFSGGKESIVTLDLCFRYFRNVKPFFMYMCPNLSFQEKTLEYYEKKYQTQIERIPHMEVSTYFRYGVFRNVDFSYPVISINDIYHYMRIKHNMWWISAGERIDDSIVRRAMMKKSGSIDEKRGRFYPVSAWKKKEIMEYIKFHGLYLSDFYRKIGFSFGALTARELIALRQYSEDDFKKVLRLYPFAGATIKRAEEYGEK